MLEEQEFAEALRRLVDQIERTSPVDDHGHNFKMNKAFLDAKTLVDAGCGAVAQASLDTAALIEQIIDENAVIKHFDDGVSDIINTADLAKTILEVLTPIATVKASPLPSTQRLCTKCGSATKGEEAFINGEIWCHPCADAIAMPIIKPGDAS